MMDDETLIGPGADFSRQNLRGRDLQGVDLSEANLSWADLTGADLRGAILRKVDLSKTELWKADLRGADLSHANLKGRDLRGVKLSGADLSWADLTEADLRKADLSKVDLSRATLRKTDLRGADLSEANLSRTGLQEVDLGGAVLTKANLVHASLYEANCEGANFEKANLSGSYPGFAYLKGANLRGADMTGANLSQTDFRETVICDADLTGIYYEERPPDFRMTTYNSNTVRPDWLVFPDDVFREETPIETAVREQRQELFDRLERERKAREAISEEEKELERGKRLEEQKALFEGLKDLTLSHEMVGKLQQDWTTFLSIVRAKCGIKTQAALRSVRDMSAWVDDDSIIVGFAFGTNTFARDLIVTTEATGQVEGVLSEMMGRSIKLVCVMGDQVVAGQE